MSSSPIDDDPRLVLQNWPIGAVDALREVTAGAVNRVIEVSAAEGPYFLRTYRHGSSGLLEREHRVIAHVRAAHVPAPAPVTTTSGATFVEAYGGFHALYASAEGRQLESAALSAEHAASIGRTLGRLHDALAAFPREGLPAPRLAWDGAAWARRLDVIEQAILEQPARRPIDEIALRRVRAQAAWLADPDCPHSHEPATRQPVHGDFHHGNLFFAGTEVSGVIDWEQNALMPRAYEAVRAATFMFDLAAAPTRAFFDAWRAETKATDDELDAGAEAFGLTRDHWAWALEEIYLSGNERAARYIPTSPFTPFHRQWAAFRGAAHLRD